MTVKKPVLSFEQLAFIKWANECKTKGVDRIQAVETLITGEPPHATRELQWREMRTLYLNYNCDNRHAITLAILLNDYEVSTPFAQGQIVTDGNMIGYAGEMHFESCTFYLYASKKAFELKASPIGREDITHFRLLKESDLHA